MILTSTASRCVQIHPSVAEGASASLRTSQGDGAPGLRLRARPSGQPRRKRCRTEHDAREADARRPLSAEHTASGPWTGGSRRRTSSIASDAGRLRGTFPTLHPPVTNTRRAGHLDHASIAPCDDGQLENDRRTHDAMNAATRTQSGSYGARRPRRYCDGSPAVDADRAMRTSSSSSAFATSARSASM